MEHECGTIDIVREISADNGWNFLEGCTGFNWVQPEKVEPPVDWATQDLVLSRPNKDEFRWVNSDYKSQWTKCYEGGLQHGAIRGGMKLEVRCRREDLPEIPDPATPFAKEPENNGLTRPVKFYEVIKLTSLSMINYQIIWTSDPNHGNRTGNTREVEVSNFI